MRTLHYIVPVEYEGSKVLHFLKREAGLSTRAIRNLKFHEDGILVNGIPTRTIDPLHVGDSLIVNLPSDGPAQPPHPFSPSEPVPEPVILYEDEDVVAVN